MIPEWPSEEGCARSFSAAMFLRQAEDDRRSHLLKMV